MMGWENSGERFEWTVPEEKWQQVYQIDGSHLHLEEVCVCVTIFLSNPGEDWSTGDPLALAGAKKNHY
ncbi:hypothetical protein TNCV_2826991 [Trichonephila clavipes]|nr:hypothetical protein TNCV_2826991 [Trichonephila clavipes]